MDIHEETLKIARNLMEKDPSLTDWVISKFPELRESEDERIKNALIRFHKSTIDIDGIKGEDVIAWLEKQGEQSKWKPSKNEMDALYALAYITNKIDDKKDGAITKLYQDLKREFLNGASYENMFPSSPVNSDINIENQGEQKTPDKVKPKFEVGDIVKHKDNPHLTYILKRFTDDGDYEFHVIGKDGNEGEACFAAVKYQDNWEFVGNLLSRSSSWSEEDEYYYGIIQYILNNKIVGKTDKENAVNWFKFLKGRVQPKQEWDEEDSYMLGQAIKCVNNSGKLDVSTEEIEYWLKSIRPQKWKPTEEHITCLQDAIDDYHRRGYKAEVLETLLKQLKQL